MELAIKNKNRLFLGLADGFSLLKPAAQELLAANGQLQELKKGTQLLRLGQPVPPVFALRSGMLTLVHTAPDGSPVTTDFFVGKSIILPSLNTKVVAGCEIRSVGSGAVVSWPLDVFKKALQLSPEFHLWVTGQILHRQQQQYFYRARISTLQLDAQLAFFLWSIGEEHSNGRRFVSGKIPQATLATYFSVTREEISRKQSLLSKTGYIEVTSEGIILNECCQVLFSMQIDTPSPWESPYPNTLFRPRDPDTDES